MMRRRDDWKRKAERRRALDSRIEHVIHHLLEVVTRFGKGWRYKGKAFVVWLPSTVRIRSKQSHGLSAQVLLGLVVVVDTLRGCLLLQLTENLVEVQTEELTLVGHRGYEVEVAQPLSVVASQDAATRPPKLHVPHLVRAHSKGVETCREIRHLLFEFSHMVRVNAELNTQAIQVFVRGSQGFIVLLELFDLADYVHLDEIQRVLQIADRVIKHLDLIPQA